MCLGAPRESKHFEWFIISARIGRRAGIEGMEESYSSGSSPRAGAAGLKQLGVGQWGWRPSFLGKRGRLGTAPRRCMASRAARKSAPGTRSFICELDGGPDDASRDCSMSNSSRYTACALAVALALPASPEQRRSDHQSRPQLGTAPSLPRV